MTGRIGILGGSFDPIHVGHLAIAEDVRVALNLDQVLLIPTAQQPFKRERVVATAEQRFAMVERACAGNPAFVASRVEIDRAGVSYTIATLETLHKTLNSELFFILGADALADLPRWRDAARLPALAHIVAVQRPGSIVDHEALLGALPALDGRLTVLDGPRLDISSSELRARAADGRSLRYRVPDTVADYVMLHQVYRNSEASKTDHLPS